MKRVMIAAFALLLLASVVEAQKLSGLNKLAVSVEDLPDVMVKAGFDKATIKAQVERRLALLGVEVVARKTGDSVVYVNLNAVEAGGCLAVTVSVEVLEPSFLYRDSDRVALAATWTERRLVLVEKLSEVRADLSELLDRLVGDYMKDNPRGKGKIRQN
jgi:hypothetical protein